MESTRKTSNDNRHSRICSVCGKAKENMMPATLIRPMVVVEIKKEFPDFPDDGQICADDLNHFRSLSYSPCWKMSKAN